MKTKLSIPLILVLTVLLSFGCLYSNAESNAQKLELTLLFEKTSDRSEGSLTTPRDFTLDKDKNIYTFDYINNRIFKFDQKGTQLAVFGKKGDGKNESKHLTNIEIVGDKLLAVDSTALFFYSLDGDFLSKVHFQQEALLEFPTLLSDNSFIGGKVLSDELKSVLTLRNSAGEEISRLDSYDLKRFFPRLKEGEDFFLNNTFAPKYLYDILADGTIVWARSDQFVLYKYENQKSSKWITGSGTVIPFPEDEQKVMRQKRDNIAKNMPSLHMFVPTVYPMIQQLFTHHNETWIYMVSGERTGFVRYNHKGKEIGFYTIGADLDFLKTRIHIFHDNIYFMVSNRGHLKIYISPVTK